MSDPLLPRPDNSPVPVSYAEKTMASLLQLHAELMEEKERRVDLYRRLMERDEALAELRYQVKVLEDRLRRAEGFPPAPPPQVAAPAAAAPPPPEDPAVVSAAVPPAPAAPAESKVIPRAVRPASALPSRAVSAKREDWRQW